MIEPRIYFSDVFNVPVATLEKYGAYNISLINDLPLFIDPFLLFHSERADYQVLHRDIIKYVCFLRDKAVGGPISPGNSRAWFYFKEVKQNWFGYSLTGNKGNGLGKEFADNLTANLRGIFQNFGSETIAHGSHLERLCLIEDGVGRDHMSDFCTNLIKGFLLEFTQTFAKKYLRHDQRQIVTVRRVRFDYKTEAWKTEKFELPWFDNDYVILTPTDLLTQEDVWINKDDLNNGYPEISQSIDNAQLRDQVGNYFVMKLAEITRRDDEKGKRSQSERVNRRSKSLRRRRLAQEQQSSEPTKKQRLEAMLELLREFPVLLDYYIRWKEDNGDKAEALAGQRVELAHQIFEVQVREFVALLETKGFYGLPFNTIEETRTRIEYLKDVIENKGGWRVFFHDGKPIGREADLQILYRLTWIGTPSDISREVDDGRGPVDFKASRGAKDKTLVEFKLARNTKLKQNLTVQTELYQKASDAKGKWKVVLCCTDSEIIKLQEITKDLGEELSKSVVVIDGRPKPSASVAREL